MSRAAVLGLVRGISVVFVVVIVLGPLFMLAVTGLMEAGSQMVVPTARIIIRSGGLAGLGVLLALAAAYPVARAISVVTLLALVLVPPVARVVGLFGLGVEPGHGAFVIARLAGDVPLVALLVRLRLLARPQSWLDAAADLGAGSWRRFVAIEWPYLRPAFGLGATLIMLRSLGDATTPAIAGGGKVYTLALWLRDSVTGEGSFRGAAATSVCFAMIAMPCAVLLSRDLSDAMTRRGRSGQSMGVLGLLLFVVLAAPLFGLLHPAFAYAWSHADELLLAQVPATLLVAGGGAVFAVALGYGAVLGIRAGSRVLALLMVPVALPPAVYGAAWIATAQAVGWQPGYTLTLCAQLPGQLAVAYTAMALAIAGTTELLAAAQDLGARTWARLRWLWLPLLTRQAPALILLVFAFTLADAGVAAFTSGPGESTLAIGLETVSRGGDVGVVPRWSLLLALLPITLTIFAKKAWRL